MKLNVLADDGPEVGFGHISRCMVLAQHFKRHGAAPVFLLNNSSPAVALVKSRGFIVKQYSSFDEIVDADLILVDSYLRNDSFFQCLASVDAFLMNRIGFLDISRIIECTLNDSDFISSNSIDDLLMHDNSSRIIASRHIKRIA